MAKQLNVSLAFTADASKAKAELQDLQRQLTQLTNAPISNSGKGFFLTKEIQDATAAAADLKVKLQQATDVNTGKLDLNKFDQSLKQSGTSLKTYREALSNLGPAGDKAFAALASSIMKADVPLRTTNRLLNEFKTTLMNTARWQISSSILHSFMGSLQSAYGYAQDLNQSLNNIRIVTGYNTDEMAKFAGEANKAAQALSTTTTNYTDAALIYYQQGIRDQDEIAARTEATIKLANVSRQSAEDVSSQMTAIWNNFDDGTHNLEYYADVITALGATTASSSQEIAKGMQQFAAVADTVGLSYEYAAASLATIVATTRQSESTVGNGLRTIFSRLEGLKLGDTLEDGTDLNKYSAALATVGVNIKDASGELKDMDTILEETASKWDQLDKAQKVAFATTVGGVRQYTNLIALLDNWDMVQENIDVAKGSKGTLQEQADIYAESWEAAEKRVRAAAEEIYNELLDDDFFITLLDGFKDFLNIVNNTIDAIGGLKGVLIAVGALVTNIFQRELASEINRISQNFRIITGQAAQATTDRKAEAASEMQKMTADSVDENTGLAMSTVYSEQGKLQQELINNASRLSEERKKELQVLLDINAAQGQNVIKMAESADAVERELKAEEKRILLKTKDVSIKSDVNIFGEQMRDFGKLNAAASGLKAAFQEASIEGDKINVSLKGAESCLDRLKGLNFDDATADAKEIDALLLKLQITLEAMESSSGETLEGLKTDAIETSNKLEEISTKAANIKIQSGMKISSEDANAIKQYGINAFEGGQKSEQSKQSIDSYGESCKKVGEEAKKSGANISNLGKQITATAQTVTASIMLINNLSNAIKTLANPNLSDFEKFTGILGSIAMTVPMIISSLSSLKTAFFATGTAGEAMWAGVLGPIGIVIAGIAAVTTAVGLMEQNEKQALETKEKNAQAARENADAINQEAKENEKLISSMEDLLARYNDGEDVKEELNSITNTLAEAYDVEGAAVARLTGRYEDYETALNNAKQKKLEMLDEQIADNKEAMDKSGVALLSAAKGGIFDSKQVSADNTYSFSIESSLSANTDTTDKKAMEILRNNIKSANIQNSQKSSGSGVSTGEVTTFSIENINQNLNQLVALYHEIEKARSEIVNGPDGIGEEAASNSKVYNDLGKYLDSIKSYIDEYEQYSQNYESLLQKRNNPIDQIKSYDDYKKWVNEIKSSFKEAGYDDNFISGYISNEYKNATKEVQKFADAYQASQDIIKKSNVSEENIAKAFGAEEGYDANVAALMNWSMLSDETWESAYQGAKKYYDAIQQNVQATEDLANAQNALSDFGTKLTKSSTKKLVKDLEWGKTDENGNEIIMQYSDFLLLSSEKQLSYLKNLEKEAAISTKETLQEQIESEKSILQEYYDWRNSEQAKQEAQARDDAQKTINDIQLIRAAFAKDSDINNWSDDDKNLLNQYGNGATNLSTFNDNVSETEESAQNTISIYDDKITAIQNYEDHIASMNQDMQEASLTESLMYESLSELNQAFSTGSISGIDYRTALVTMAAEYGNCEAELDNYKKALESGSEKTIKAAKEQLELAIAAGEVAKKSGYEGKEFEKLTRQIKELAKENDIVSKKTQESEKDLTDVAKAAKQTEAGLSKLDKSWKSWKEALKGKDELQKVSAMIDLKDALAEVMDISDELEKYGITLGDHFGDYLLENMDKVEAAANGDRDAILDLQQIATEDILIQLGFDEEANQALFDYLDSTMDLIRSKLDDGSLKIGAVDDTDLINSLNQMLTAVGNDVDKAQQILAGLGFNATFVEGEAPETDQYWVPATYHTETETTGGENQATGSYSKLVLDEPGRWESDTSSRTTQALKIDTLNYTGGGNVSGAKGGTGRRSGGGGGGGGGSKPKAAKKKDVTKKFENKEADRYIKINQELSQKEHENTLLDTKLKSTSGKTAIKTMQQQLELLKQQQKLYKDLEKEAKAYREKDLAKMKEDFAELDFQIDPSSGMLLNYETLLREQTDLYNKVYTEWTDKIIEAERAYNDQITLLGEAATDEALKPWADALEKIKEDSKDPLREAEEKFEKFKKDTDKYNDSVEQAQKAEEEAAAKALEAYNQELEIIAKGIEIKIKVDDADLQYLEFLLKQIGDTVDGTLDRMANYAESIESNMSKIEKYQDGLEDVLDHAGIDFDDLLDGDLDDLGTFNEEDLAKVEEYRDGLISCGEQLIDLRKKILNEVHEAFSKFNSDLDDAVGRIEHLKKFTETYKNIIDIIGKKVIDPTGQTTLMLTKTLYTQSQANTRALQDQLDFQLSAVKRYEEAIAELEADNRHGEHDDTIKEFKEQLKEAQQAYESTQESWLSSWESTVQAAADIYEAELNQILEDFNKSVAGLMGSLDKLSERYNRIQATQSIYVEDYEKIYQLSKLTRDINNSLDDSTTLASKGKLRDIQKEINALQESGLEVSQYDLDVLRKKYEMAIAYEQWQDAQNAKTVVRMQRDNEGNYGYVYTADQSDVEAAQQNYEDKLHEMQVLNGDYINSLQEQIIQAEQECADALANLRASDYASYEEYQAAVEQIRSDYTERVEALSSQLAKALGNNQKLYETDWTEYSKATGYKISADKDYIDRFEETVLSQLTGFKTIEEAQDAFVIATNDASDQAAERWEDWYIRSNDALELGGMSMQNYTEEVDEAINGSGGIVEQTQDAEEAVDEMADEYSEKFDDIVDYAEEFARDFDDVIQDIIDSCNEAIEAIRNLLEMMAELDGSDYDSDNDVIEGEWDKRKDENGNEYWYVQDKKTKQAINGENVKISWAGDEHTQGYTTTYNVINGVMQTEGRNALGTGGGGTTFSEEEIKKLHKHAMASGGYTGDWGDSSGRLAVLHEKELVLNSNDTANILSAVDMIRSISNAIDLNALAAGAVFAGRGAAVVSSFGKDTLEQNVHITAEFPSVSDHNEIEEALNSLVERAAQFAGRKKF